MGDGVKHGIEEGRSSSGTTRGRLRSVFNDGFGRSSLVGGPLFLSGGQEDFN